MEGRQLHRGPEQVTIGDFNREVENQPEYLTRAILEQTIGDPLYPGMEMWWIAKNANTVGQVNTVSPSLLIFSTS